MDQQQPPEASITTPASIIMQEHPIYKSPLELREDPSKIIELLKSQFDFEMENKVRSLVHSIVDKLNYKVENHSGQIKNFLVQVEQCNSKLQQIGISFDKFGQIRNAVADQRKLIEGITDSIGRDVKDALENHESMILKIAGFNNQLRDFKQERNIFVHGLDRCREEIKQLENLINEQRTVHDKNIVSHRQEVAKSFQTIETALSDLAIDRNQYKAMVKNQNFHFTELQKQIGVLNYKYDQLSMVAQKVPEIQEQINKTDDYLNYYQPMEICTQIHSALKASFEHAPTRQKLDAMEYASSRLQEIMNKINRIGQALPEDALLKDNYRILRLDVDMFNLAQQWEQEEMQRVENERLAQEAKLKAKDPQQIFEDHLFNENTLQSLSEKVFYHIAGDIERLTSDQIETQLETIKQSRSDSRTNSEYDSEGSSNQIESRDSSRQSESSSEPVRRSRSQYSSQSKSSELSPGLEKSPSQISRSSNSSVIQSPAHQLKSEPRQPKKLQKVAKHVKEEVNREQSEELDYGVDRLEEETPIVVVKKKRPKVVYEYESEEETPEEQVVEPPQTKVRVKKVNQKRPSKVPSKVIEVDSPEQSHSEKSEPYQEVIEKQGEALEEQFVKPSSTKVSLKKVSQKRSSKVSNRAIKVDQPEQIKSQKSEDHQDGFAEVEETQEIVVTVQLKSEQTINRVNVAEVEPKVRSRRRSEYPSKQIESKRESIKETQHEETQIQRQIISSQQRRHRDGLKPSSNSTKKRERVSRRHREEYVKPSSNSSKRYQYDQVEEPRKSRPSVHFTSEEVVEGAKNHRQPSAQHQRQETRESARSKDKYEEKKITPKQQEREVRDERRRRREAREQLRKEELLTSAADVPQVLEEITSPLLSKEVSSRFARKLLQKSKQNIEEDARTTHRIESQFEKKSEEKRIQSREKQLRERMSKTRKPEKIQVTVNGEQKVSGAKEEIISSPTIVSDAHHSRQQSILSKQANKDKKLRIEAELMIQKAANQMNDQIIAGLQDTIKQLQAKVENCVTRTEWDQINSEVPRFLAEIGIFKEKIRIFEQSMEEQKQTTAIAQNISQIRERIAQSFSKYKETKSRIQRLNESEIIELRNIMTELAGTVHTIYIKQAESDAEKLKIQNNRLPRDIQYLAKDEVTLRRELALSLEDTEDMKQSLFIELKRLRREHYNNLKDLEQIIAKFDVQEKQVRNVLERQGLNDQAMSAIFKIMKLDHSLTKQDETDRESIYLMGITTANNSQRTSMAQTVRGDFHFGACDSPKTSTVVGKRAHVISLNRNCLSHEQTNEAVMKAFKMACLNYESAPVEFEQNYYSRKDLIKAKGDLLLYCLGQLKHLDLSRLDQHLHINQLNVKTTEINELNESKEPSIDLTLMSPNNYPQVPPLNSRHGEFPGWLNQDSIESLQKIANRYQGAHKSLASQKKFRISIDTSGSLMKTNTKHTDSPRISTSKNINSISKESRNPQFTQPVIQDTIRSAQNDTQRQTISDQLDESSFEGPSNYETPYQILYTTGISAKLQKRTQARNQDKPGKSYYQKEAKEHQRSDQNTILLTHSQIPREVQHLPQIRQSMTKTKPNAMYLSLQPHDEPVQVFSQEITIPTSRQLKPVSSFDYHGGTKKEMENYLKATAKETGKAVLQSQVP